ncbi:MAG: alanine racemase, partial [Acidimicrobiia bacterium]|nr:alanine racemase [Acidimicrobiia bacterium]
MQEPRGDERGPAVINEAPLDPSLLPPGLRELDAARVADEFGTPTFVYDEDEVRRRCRDYVAGFGADAVAYAGKAFLCTAMARLVVEEGLHLDCATSGELHVARHAGVPGERIVLHGNNKSDQELGAALDAGVGRIVADSFDELDRLEALAGARGLQPTVLVRVTPGVEAHTHEYIETGTEASKFGFTLTDGVALAAIRRVAASPVLQLAGLHCHIGSQISRLDAFGRAIERLAALAAELARDPQTGDGTGDGSGNGAAIGIEELNLGG